MDLHAECGTTDDGSTHARRGFARFMQLHKKRCTKRAGEAGVALRAGTLTGIEKKSYRDFAKA